MNQGENLSDSFPNRWGIWGIASLLLLVGNFAFSEYNLHLQDIGQHKILSTAADCELCLLMNLAAAAFGIVAIRRESRWWLMTVIPATWLAIVCFLCDL